MTEKGPEPTTFKLGGTDLEKALELRHIEEKKTKHVVTVTAIVRAALTEHYKRVMAQEEDKTDGKPTG